MIMKKILIYLWLLSFSWMQVSLAYGAMPHCHQANSSVNGEAKALGSTVGFCPHHQTAMKPLDRSSLQNASLFVNQPQDTQSPSQTTCCDLAATHCHCQSANLFSSFTLVASVDATIQLVFTQGIQATHFSTNFPTMEKRPPRIFA